MNHSNMNPTKMERNARRAATLLKALSNPQRLLILCHLTTGERSVGQLEKEMKMRQPHLSQQLARLRHDKLVRARRDSRVIYYSLRDGQAEKLIDYLYGMFCAAAAAKVTTARVARTKPPAPGSLAPPEEPAPAAEHPRNIDV